VKDKNIPKLLIVRYVEALAQENQPCDQFVHVTKTIVHAHNPVLDGVKIKYSSNIKMLNKQ